MRRSNHDDVAVDTSHFGDPAVYFAGVVEYDRMSVCPSCGQTLPRDFLFVGTSEWFRVEGKQRLVLQRVLKAGVHGVHAEVLFEHIYGNDVDGGPDFKCLAVTIRHLNKKLAPLGKRVWAGHKKRFYRLEDVSCKK